MKVCVEFDWTDAGSIRLDPDGKLVFPGLPGPPSIYRLRLSNGVESSIYIGETDDLGRRGAHYRNPAPAQLTNIRLNNLVKRLLAEEGSAEVSIADNVTLAINGEPVSLDLTRKPHRRLLESAALVATMTGEASGRTSSRLVDAL